MRQDQPVTADRAGGSRQEIIIARTHACRRWFRLCQTEACLWYVARRCYRTRILRAAAPEEPDVGAGPRRETGAALLDTHALMWWAWRDALSAPRGTPLPIQTTMLLDAASPGKLRRNRIGNCPAAFLPPMLQASRRAWLHELPISRQLGSRRQSAGILRTHSIEFHRPSDHQDMAIVSMRDPWSLHSRLW